MPNSPAISGTTAEPCERNGPLRAPCWPRHRLSCIFYTARTVIDTAVSFGVPGWAGTGRLVATYHTPEQRFNELVNDAAHISSLDAVVIMSEVQRPIFAELLDNDRVHFVPHGVDTDYFQPADRSSSERENESIRCITVGNHLRDYNSLAQVAKRSAKQQLNVEFVVVANPRLVSALQGLSNVECLHGVDDNELLRALPGG